MADKLKLVSSDLSWREKERSWELQKDCFQKNHPIKTLSHRPLVAGITTETARFLKWKSLFYLIRKDKNKVFLRYFFKRPLRHVLALLRSYCQKKSFSRDGDFFFYGIQDEQDFKQQVLAKDPLILVGFSYCHKPFECPSGRFSPECIHDAAHPVCGQCFIGKCMHLLPSRNIQPLFIPTIHYIGEKVFEAVFQNPGRDIFFLITACEMTLQMFGDWGNMAHAKGIGVRLDGRICNTMKAFELSEEGIKPGLTIVLDPTQKRILDLIEFLHSRNGTTCGKA
jgi:hypothetical protein